MKRILESGQFSNYREGGKSGVCIYGGCEPLQIIFWKNDSIYFP